MEGAVETSAMRLAVTIDVEEEGLFTGHYSSGDISVANISWPRRLDPLFLEWEVRPTLQRSR